MRASPCIRLGLELDRRVALLMEEYDFFVRDPAACCARLDALRALRGHETVNAWQAAAHSGRSADVVRELLTQHYDPIYLQSMRRNFSAIDEPALALVWDGSGAALEAAATRCLLAFDPGGETVQLGDRGRSTSALTLRAEHAEHRGPIRVVLLRHRDELARERAGQPRRCRGRIRQRAVEIPRDAPAGDVGHGVDVIVRTTSLLEHRHERREVRPVDAQQHVGHRGVLSGETVVWTEA